MNKATMEQLIIARKLYSNLKAQKHKTEKEKNKILKARIAYLCYIVELSEMLLV